MRAMSDLQARRDAQTRAELSEVAIELFAEHGFVETTMEAVAEAAGTSRRTAYRHYANKEDLVFEETRVWMEIFNEVIASREEAESTRDVCRRGIMAVAEHIDANRGQVLPGYGVVAATPQLQSRYARTNREWLERYVELIAADLDEQDRVGGLHAAVLAGALVGGTDGAIIQWALSPGATLVDLIEPMLERVEPLWPEASRGSR